MCLCAEGIYLLIFPYQVKNQSLYGQRVALPKTTTFQES